MNNIVNNDRTTKIISVVLAVVFGVMFVSIVASAVTTISTSISTGGTLTVGSAGTAVSGMVFGYCTIDAVTDVTAASTTYTYCTGATGVVSGDRVFIQATSSMPVATFVAAASSTATAGQINLRLHANAGAASIAANTVSLNFWAVR